MTPCRHLCPVGCCLPGPHPPHSRPNPASSPCCWQVEAGPLVAAGRGGSGLPSQGPLYLFSVSFDKMYIVFIFNLNS